MKTAFSRRMQDFTVAEWAFYALLALVFTIPFSIAMGQVWAVCCLLLFPVALYRKQVRLAMPAVMWLAGAFIILSVFLSGWQGSCAGLPGRAGKLFWFVLIPVTASLVNAPGRDRKVVWAFLGGCAVLGLKDLVEYPVAAFRKPVPDYLTALIDKGSMTDGQMLMLGVVGSFLLLVVALKERRAAWWQWAILVAQGAGLVINFKRGSWFCAIILIGVMVLMNFRWKAWLLATVVVVGFLLLPPVQTRLGELRKEFNVEGGGRLTMWFKIAPVLVQEHPGGIGYGCLTNDKMRRTFSRVEPNRNHLHANWAQVLVETGWLGLFLYLAWMMKSLADGAARARRGSGAPGGNQAVAWVLLLMLCGLLLNGLVEYNFGDTEMMFVYAVMIGTVASGQRKGCSAGGCL